VRPHGRNVPATPLLVDALEQMAAQPRHQRATVPPILYPVQALLRFAGALAVKREREQVAAVRAQRQSTE